MEDGVLERLCVQITVMTGWISRAGGVTASGELSRTNAPERSPVGMRSVQMPNLACWSQSPGSVCSDAAWIEAKYGGGAELRLWSDLRGLQGLLQWGLSTRFRSSSGHERRLRSSQGLGRSVALVLFVPGHELHLVPPDVGRIPKEI